MSQPRGTVVMLRFEEDQLIPHRDEQGNLADLARLATSAMIDGIVGKAVFFSPGDGDGLTAQDQVAGTTLLQRDVSVQVILLWNPDDQGVGTPGTLIVRGKGNGAAEYHSYGLELRAIDTTKGELRWLWQTTAGVLKTQIGGHFEVADGSAFMMLTATRRWVSPTEVLLRYYAGDQLLAEVLSVDGDIGGGTTGTTSIGTRFTGGAYGVFLAGAIDELRVLDRELAPEEVAATWRRLIELQPDGVRMIRDYLPPGLPISGDPASRVQGDLRTIGQGLGFAAAQIENVRDNLMPDRAYGAPLRRWETITAQNARPSDDTDRRRARVVGHLRQHSGVSVPGVDEALEEVLAIAGEQLEVLAFDNTIRDDFSDGDTPAELWLLEPLAQWDEIGTLQAQAAAAADLRWDGSHQLAYTALLSPQSSVAAEIFAKLTPTTYPDNIEAGICALDRAHGHAFFLGLRRSGANYQVVRQRFENLAAIEAVTVLATTAQVDHWFHLQQQTAPPPAGGRASYTVKWSTTGPASGFSSVANLDWVQDYQWAGLYLRAHVASLGGGADARIDDVQLRTPHGTRPFRWYVFRDPTLPGAPDLLGGRGIVRRMKHAHTEAEVITSKSLRCDDVTCGCDRTPMGAL